MANTAAGSDAYTRRYAARPPVWFCHDKNNNRERLKIKTPPCISPQLSRKSPLGKIESEQGVRAFVISPLVAESHQENRFAYDELTSGQSVYTYVGGNPLSFVDPLGLAQFGKRPLEGMPFMVNSPMDNYSNTEISHEQVFYEDGKQPSNEGFFGDSKVRPDATKNIPNYKMYGPHYDDATMRDAVSEAKKSMKPYCLIGNNCQDFADKIRDEYERQRQKRNSCQQ